MRPNKGEYVRISHSMKADSKLSQFDGKRKKEQELGRKEEMESERREECERISISMGFKTSVADRDGNRQMEGDGPRETVSI